MRADRNLGWFAVADSWADEKLHDLYKIPHHGSHNGDHDEIWTRLVCGAPTVVTAPFVKGKVELPSRTDCERIVGRARSAYITSPPTTRRYETGNRKTVALVRNFAKNARLVGGRNGQVRLRKSIFAETGWNVELFGEATSVSSLS